MQIFMRIGKTKTFSKRGTGKDAEGKQLAQRSFRKDTTSANMPKHNPNGHCALSVASSLFSKRDTKQITHTCNLRQT